MQTTQMIQGKQRIMMQQKTASEPAASNCSRTLIVPLVLFVDSFVRSISGVFVVEEVELLLLGEVLGELALVELLLVRLAFTVSLRVVRISVSSVMLRSVMFASVKFKLVMFTLVKFPSEAYRFLRSVFRPLTFCLAKAMSVSLFVEMITAIDTRNATVTELRNFTMMRDEIN